MMATEKKLIRGKEVLRETIRRIKPLLPKDYVQRLHAAHPGYDTRQGADLVNNVISLKSTDHILTEILERIAEDYQNELARRIENQEPQNS